MAPDETTHEVAKATETAVPAGKTAERPAEPDRPDGDRVAAEGPPKQVQPDGR